MKIFLNIFTQTKIGPDWQTTFPSKR